MYLRDEIRAFFKELFTEAYNADLNWLYIPLLILVFLIPILIYLNEKYYPFVDKSKWVEVEAEVTKTFKESPARWSTAYAFIPTTHYIYVRFLRDENPIVQKISIKKLGGGKEKGLFKTGDKVKLKYDYSKPWRVVLV